MMLISQSLGLAPSNPLSSWLGLGPHFEKTNRNNFKCSRPCPFLLVMTSLFACWDDPSSIASLVIFMYFWITSLEEATIKKKHPGYSFLAFHACNGQCKWLILPFEIGSNFFKLLCIEVIFKYNIMFLIDYWYYHFICNACLPWSRSLDLTREYF